jgi:hypothetical protein
MINTQNTYICMHVLHIRAYARYTRGMHLALQEQHNRNNAFRFIRQQSNFYSKVHTF